MRLGRRVLRCKPELLSNAQVHVACLARLQQRSIAGSNGRDVNFLLAEVAMNESAARRWCDQEAQPLCRTKDKFCIRGCVSPGLGAVGPERCRAIPAVVTDLKLMKF